MSSFPGGSPSLAEVIWRKWENPGNEKLLKPDGTQVHPAVLTCFSLSLPMAAGAQLDSYYGIKLKFWWLAFILLDCHQKIFKVSRWSRRNPTKPGGSTLRMRGNHSKQPPVNHFLTAIDTALCGSSRSLEKTQYSWITANREKENKQALLAMFSSSV